MGGKILETEAKTIYRQGFQKGIQEGAMDALKIPDENREKIREALEK